MDQGKIVEDCTKDEFFNTPRGERAQQFLSKIFASSYSDVSRPYYVTKKKLISGRAFFFYIEQ